MIDLVRPSHACSMSLMTSALAMSGGLLASICLQRPGAVADLLGEANEVVEELFFAGNQTETGHVTSIIEGS